MMECPHDVLYVIMLYISYSMFLVLVTVRSSFFPLPTVHDPCLKTLNTSCVDLWSCKCFGHSRLGFPDEWILRLSDFREPSGPSTDWPTRSNFTAPRKSIEVGEQRPWGSTRKFPKLIFQVNGQYLSKARIAIQISHHLVSHCSPKITHDLQLICQCVPRQRLEFRQVVTYWKRTHVSSEILSKYTHIYCLLQKLYA